jgi:hypothetical protein
MENFQEIMQEIETLGAELQHELFDFIHYPKSRHSAEEEFHKQQVDSALRHREHSEEKQGVKAEEWLSLPNLWVTSPDVVPTEP